MRFRAVCATLVFLGLPQIPELPLPLHAPVGQRRGSVGKSAAPTVAPRWGFGRARAAGGGFVWIVEWSGRATSWDGGLGARPGLFFVGRSGVLGFRIFCILVLHRKKIHVWTLENFNVIFGPFIRRRSLWRRGNTARRHRLWRRGT
jgi:hypothetical protein